MQSGLKTACALALSGLLLGWAASAQAASLTIKTAEGKVVGKSIHDGQVKAFLGLPYAAPPVGDRRWRAPAPPARWKGTRDATRFGAHCYQTTFFDDMVFLDGQPSEDCLYLNVYAPANSTATSKLPVMFWIHGGGYAGGASSEPRHNGDFIPLKGVVLVTINYRLGVFGFLATSEMAQEAGGSAGNYGLLDQVAALEWVKANIARFGGDPANVTIFGESAGSFAVSTLMASPRTRGLFQKAIGESGSALSSAQVTPLEQREKRDGDWVASLGIASLTSLRAQSAQWILNATAKLSMMHFAPVIDGKLLVEPISETYAAGRQAHIPLLAGWNRDEGGLPRSNATAEKWKAYLDGHFPGQAAEFLKYFPADTDEQAALSAAEYAGDSFIAFGTWKWIEEQRKTGDAPVYRYHFELRTLPSKFRHELSASHSDEIEYVFGTLATRPGQVVRPEDEKLSDQMMSYWTNFAKTGDPNGAGLPAWPRYDKDGLILRLDSTITTAPDILQPRYEFLLKAMPASAL